LEGSVRKKIVGCLSLAFFSALCDDITFINSDNTKYAKDVVICGGNVIVIYGGRIISADKIAYDKKKEIIHAEGNVIVKDEKENVYFLDSMSINKDFSSGEGEDRKSVG
jgi:lipopolysaccharide assembly outer membrane protein LptD (OstA)